MASLTSIHVGDIVEVDVKGRRAFAVVQDKQAKTRDAPARLLIRAITSGFNWQQVTAHQVIGHYRKTKNTRKIGVKVNGGDATGHDAAE